ncbi:uncharacterized protein LOC128962830 [Oppia nitens]|uniref:uncharacterized protein LOC128962830 n=1 Tax=Oppia nitens TaxID=1686743 RepID=UPI0023D9B912|nr:uncharacterized protein LOC128962830 [Oppia nitens]
MYMTSTSFSNTIRTIPLVIIIVIELISFDINHYNHHLVLADTINSNSSSLSKASPEQPNATTTITVSTIVNDTSDGNGITNTSFMIITDDDTIANSTITTKTGDNVELIPPKVAKSRHPTTLFWAIVCIVIALGVILGLICRFIQRSKLQNRTPPTPPKVKSKDQRIVLIPKSDDTVAAAGGGADADRTK